MAITGDDIFDFAEGLWESNQTNASEVVLRQITSRAYYGAFLSARDKAGIKSTGKSVHQETADFWRQKKKEPIANRLEDLKRRRELADYQIASPFTFRDAMFSIKLAKKVLSDLQ